MKEAEVAAPPPKRLRLSIKRHRSSLPPPIPKDPADIPATFVIDHLSDGSSRRKFLATSSQHGPSRSPLIARGEPIDNAGDVCCTVDKSVAASPLSSDGFVAGSLAAEEIYLLPWVPRKSAYYVDVLPQPQISDPQKLLVVVLFQAQAIFQSFFSSANSGMAEAEGKKEKDKDFLVQCSQRFPSESKAAEVPAHDAILALEEEEEEARENFNLVLEQ
ncbi:unnamed protein product [Sphagnum jensenii]|uniref:Uncharacterized protein n=1 Tax=Sphagnum jensenii TaxID=128206 RepID=A0ABP1B641_9BRYO